MAAKNLTTAEMIGVTQQWTTSAEVAPILDPRDALDARGVVRAVERAHTALVSESTVADTSEHAKTLDAIHAKATNEDGLHDRKGRSASNLLEALSDLSDDPAEAERYAALRRKLFPTGDLSGLQISWRGESGNAARLQQQLTEDPTLVAALEQIPAGVGSTLLAQVRQFVGAGQRLGALEDERVRVEDLAAGQKSGATGQRPEAAARNAWIRAVDTLVSTVENSEDITPQQRQTVMRVYRDVEARADKRAIARRAPSGDDDGGTPGGGATD